MIDTLASTPCKGVCLASCGKRGKDKKIFRGSQNDKNCGIKLGGFSDCLV